MADNISTGKVCKVMIGANVVSFVTNWSLTKTTNTEDLSHMGTVDEEYIPTTNSWSATFDGFLNTGDTSGVMALIAAQKAQTKITPLFYDDTAGYESGDAYITSIKEDAAAKNATKVSFTVQGTGALTRV